MPGGPRSCSALELLGRSRGRGGERRVDRREVLDRGTDRDRSGHEQLAGQHTQEADSGGTGDTATERAEAEQGGQRTGRDEAEGSARDAAEGRATDSTGQGADGGTGGDGVLQAGEGGDLTVVRGLPGGESSNGSATGL